MKQAAVILNMTIGWWAGLTRVMGGSGCCKTATEDGKKERHSAVLLRWKKEGGWDALSLNQGKRSVAKPRHLENENCKMCGKEEIPSKSGFPNGQGDTKVRKKFGKKTACTGRRKRLPKGHVE